MPVPARKDLLRPAKSIVSLGRFPVPATDTTGIFRPTGIPPNHSAAREMRSGSVRAVSGPDGNMQMRD